MTAGLDAREERAADAGLERGAVQAVGRDRPPAAPGPGPVVGEVVVLPALHVRVLVGVSGRAVPQLFGIGHVRRCRDGQPVEDRLRAGRRCVDRVGPGVRRRCLPPSCVSRARCRMG